MSIAALGGRYVGCRNVLFSSQRRASREKRGQEGDTAFKADLHVGPGVPDHVGLYRPPTMVQVYKQIWRTDCDVSLSVFQSLSSLQEEGKD
ncbi:hypothetical protein BaRGS_00023818 [Batillaria attramentaria]|uniref:Uncharacterized protein n=1 Tax=Batillaria attramentaria TaxID=370345 RepID=A0ABD0KCN9_9CAEN